MLVEIVHFWRQKPGEYKLLMNNRALRSAAYFCTLLISEGPLDVKAVFTVLCFSLRLFIKSVLNTIFVLPILYEVAGSNVILSVDVIQSFGLCIYTQFSSVVILENDSV